MLDVKISILVPVYDVEICWLEVAIDSVRNQTYSNWELCLVDDCSTKSEVREYLKNLDDRKIKVHFLDSNVGIALATNEAAKMAIGEYLLLLDNDDELSEDALAEIVAEIEETEADVLYSDQDIVDVEGVHSYILCKPDWSPDLLLSQMYIGHVLVFRKALFEKVGGFRKEYTGSQDYDLMLRFSRETNRIAHISKVLYSWRTIPTSTACNPDSKPYAQKAGQQAIQEHLDHVYGKNKTIVNETENLFVYDVRYVMPSEPKVSVIIQGKRIDRQLKKRIELLLERTEYSNYELILLTDRTKIQEYDTVLKEIEVLEKVSVYKLSSLNNWAHANNFGISAANGSVYIFLNENIEIASPQWMRRFAEKVVLSEVGVVGGLLLFNNNTVYHAGFVVGPDGWLLPIYKGIHPSHYSSPYISPMVSRNVTALSGACMAVAKETVRKIGVFNETFLIEECGVEYCLRARYHGYRNIYDPYVMLYYADNIAHDNEAIGRNSQKLDSVCKEYGVETDPYFNEQLNIYSCVPKLRDIHS